MDFARHRHQRPLRACTTGRRSRGRALRMQCRRQKNNSTQSHANRRSQKDGLKPPRQPYRHSRLLKTSNNPPAAPVAVHAALYPRKNPPQVRLFGNAARNICGMRKQPSIVKSGSLCTEVPPRSQVKGVTGHAGSRPHRADHRPGAGLFRASVYNVRMLKI